MSKPMGMMSGCYFVGREELLDWVNNFLSLNYTRVEDTANGAAFCQIIDAIHPGTVALGRVNYNALDEPEMISNYKILQDSFTKNGITQYIDVATLVKGRYMAALELFQWVHGYFQQTGPHDDYDAVARRKARKCAAPNERVHIGKPKPAGMAKRKGAEPAKPSVAGNEVGQIPGRVKPEHKREVPRVAQKKPEPRPAPKKVPAREPASSGIPSAAASSVPDPSLLKEIKRLKKQVQELEEEANQRTQERDFYFEKLRNIEDYCQDNKGEGVVDGVLEILYEADESRGFLPPEEEEEYE